MCDDETLEHLRRQGEQRRKHAAFFSWHDRSPSGKQVAETGLVRTLLEAMTAEGVAEYRNPRPSGDDWPDCVVDRPDGAAVAVEVTELVDENALPNGASVPWPAELVRDRLQAILVMKDSKAFGGGKYSHTVILIHTDEFYLDPDTLTPALKDEIFALPHRNVDRAFLLFSYDPKRQGYPFLELRLAA